MSPTKSLPACLVLSFASFTAQAADGPAPPSVSEPSGINLGGTSFYDGFAGPPGLSHLTYLKFSTARSMKDNRGKNNEAFDNPKINVVTLINQLSYYSANTMAGGAHLGWSLLVPIISLDGDFGDNGAKLKDNGTGLGDITVGPQVQFDPIVDSHGRPVFVQRVAFDTVLPTGKYDKHKDLNQGSNFYSLNPYWAATWMPAPRWEVSGRLHYLYNFKNKDPASSSAQFFNGQPVRHTQAGQAAWSNFTVSYAVIPNLSVGINGYYFKQLSDDKVNGSRLPSSRETVLGIGPGAFWKVSEAQGFWLNTFKEVDVKNRSRTNMAIQVRYAHSF
ncbi:SphA family protein [Pseudomonas typographi]|uniref:SphA family protein n=1 Tax=Pseudomonas typographi TaxID=2715964 RepID=UPI001683ABF3|nr:transporter [Pseudomonas typographi]MBD1550571.1 phenol degradation protein meta [Pseudomonas typographi]MBD1586843.1 phenol degradation protein meta [Pseudomonas typographi]